MDFSDVWSFNTRLFEEYAKDSIHNSLNLCFLFFNHSLLTILINIWAHYTWVNVKFHKLNQFNYQNPPEISNNFNAKKKSSWLKILKQ